MSSTHPPEVLGLLSDPLRWQHRPRAGEQRPPRRRARGPRRQAAERRLVSPGRAAQGRRRDLPPELGRRARRLLPRRPDPMPRHARRGRWVPASGSVARASRTARAPASRVGRACCSSAPATAHGLRSPRRSRCTAPTDKSAPRSAGSHPKPLHPNAVRVLAERGIDISSCSTKPLARYAGRRFDRVITLCDKVREVCPEFPGAPTSAHWSMPDPASSGPDDEATYPTFVQIADDIEDRVALSARGSRRHHVERAAHG